jgi:hypothetical protein
MSPEQARARPVDKRADVWTFGCVLYEMLTGRSAFGRETVSDTIAAVLEREPDWPLLERHAPSHIVRTIRRCLQKDLKLRLRDIGDARVDLEITPNETVVTESPRPAGRVRWVFASLAVLCIALGLVAGRNLSTAQSAPSAAPPTFTRLTFRDGFIWAARFAPDGKTVVYSASWGNGAPDVYVSTPGVPEARALGFAPADLLAVSSKGELALRLSPTIGPNLYLRTGVLARAPLTGGVPRESIESVRHADWSPDGKDLAVVKTAPNVQLEYPAGHVFYRGGDIWFPRVSPSGERIAFFEGVSGASGFHLMVVDRSGRATNLGGNAPDPAGIVWSSREDALWVGLALSGQTSSVYYVDLQGHWRPAINAPGLLELHDVSSAGQFLVTRAEQRAFVGGVLPDGSTRDLTWLDRTAIADVSADARTLLLAEVGDGGGIDRGIYLRSVDGSPAKRLADGMPLALSPDGRWVVARPLRPPLKLTLIPTGAGDTRVFELGAIATIGQAEWFPDGRRILFVGTEPGSPPRSYVLDLNTNDAPKPALSDNGVGTLISPDGTTIAGRSGPETIKLWQLDGRPPVVVSGVRADESLVSWTADARAILVVRRSPLPAVVTRIEVATGRRTLWKEITPPTLTGTSGINQIFVPIRGDGAYFYSQLRNLNELYAVDGVN